MQDLEKAADIIKRYEDIIKTKNKEIKNVAYHQGQVFKKFKKKEKFAKLVSLLSFLELMFLNCVKPNPNY